MIRARCRGGQSAEEFKFIACRFFLFRWHRAHTCRGHPLKVRTATSTDRWPRQRGSQARMSEVLRTLSWAHVRCASGEPLGAAAWHWHTPAWPGSAHCVRSSYVNCALFGISTSADRWPPCLEGDFGDPGETFREAPEKLGLGTLQKKLRWQTAFRYKMLHGLQEAR